MMPKKPPHLKRSLMIGVKVDEDTKIKLNYLSEMKGEKTSTYIFNLLKNHIAEKEPWISAEIEEIKDDKQETLK